MAEEGRVARKEGREHSVSRVCVCVNCFQLRAQHQ